MNTIDAVAPPLTEDRTVRVVVVDDHGLTVSAVSDSLEVHGLDVVGRASCARSAVDEVVKHQPDVLVIDLDLGPGPTGIHVAITLRRRFPRLGVVVLSGYADPRLLSPTVPAAPPGTVYLVKQRVSEISTVVAAVHDAAQRAVLGLPATVPTVDLTHTQVAVLDLVAQGLTNSAIAERLHITEDTVSKTINRMAKRLRIPQGPETNTRGSLANRYFEFVGNRRRP